MRNPFEKPQSLQQWLLSSVCWAASCWAASCWAGFCAISWGLLVLWRSDNCLFLVFGLALFICVLMWRQVISVGWRQLWASEEPMTWLGKIAGLWLLLLTGLFLLSSVSLAFGILILVALAGESGGGGWQ